MRDTQASRMGKEKNGKKKKQGNKRKDVQLVSDALLLIHLILDSQYGMG